MMQITAYPKLEEQLLHQQIKIEAWVREQFRLTPPPFYASIDLRHSGFKIAPVDTNLFPAGFNNLNPQFMHFYIQAAQAAMAEICPDIARVLLIPENHTRNLYYLENVAILQEILLNAGFEVRIGSLIPELNTVQTIELANQKKLILEPLQKKQDQIILADFVPDLILLNNDLSAGIPEILQHCSQKIIPNLAMGWSTRLKSRHFYHYQNVSEEFGNAIQIDPWLFAPIFEHCSAVNFITGEGMECLAGHAEKILQQTQQKYDEYNIDSKPFVVVKADAGTYGMAVMMIQDAKQLLNLNRNQRKQMATVKNRKAVTQVIIQEGVHTFETVKQKVAEPVIYTMGRCVIGGFYRVHAERGKDENLNAPGSHFEPLPFETVCNHPSHQQTGEYIANRLYIYGVIARLALIAAAREQAEVKV